MENGIELQAPRAKVYLKKHVTPTCRAQKLPKSLIKLSFSRRQIENLREHTRTKVSSPEVSHSRAKSPTNRIAARKLKQIHSHQDIKYRRIQFASPKKVPTSANCSTSKCSSSKTAINSTLNVSLPGYMLKSSSFIKKIRLDATDAFQCFNEPLQSRIKCSASPRHRRTNVRRKEGILHDNKSLQHNYSPNRNKKPPRKQKLRIPLAK